MMLGIGYCAGALAPPSSSEPYATQPALSTQASG